ncbi:MAG TPA: outer membrane beta-barrel protein [Ferrovibrio sp.]|uniref:outer membrane protein n=1 Tax=Ferrovibrio sp. TaxID=1917215 RepID=UPI002B4B4D5C|nr:outer membrane beta-barrel protein [Ferrovibrio sp.]HLT76378.1 outer membrane beta-barrel protein [Ferrovibrio sp.]
MRRLALAVIAAAAFVAPPAMAEQQKPGWYGSVAGSWLVPRDYDGSGSFDEVKTYNGYGFALGAGYRYGNGFRAEAELAYGNVENDRVTRDNAGSTKVGGDIDMYSLTGAVYYDIPVNFVVTPFVGAGAGIVHQRNSRPATTIGGATLPAGGDSTDLTAFGEIGLTYQLTPEMTLVPSYRYQWINDGEHGLDDTGMHVARLALHYGF